MFHLSHGGGTVVGYKTRSACLKTCLSSFLHHRGPLNLFSSLILRETWQHGRRPWFALVGILWFLWVNNIPLLHSNAMFRSEKVVGRYAFVDNPCVVAIRNRPKDRQISGMCPSDMHKLMVLWFLSL